MSHPEVNYVSLVTLLFAGKTSLISFNYSTPIEGIVKILKRRSQSAGFSSTTRASETLRSGVEENLKPISVHVPKHQKPLNDTQFGYYLAGLIDGDGHFDCNPHLRICFNSNDIALAYYLKTRIGFGNVYKVKNKNAVILVISKRAGLNKVLDLINGKLRKLTKVDQI